jgi:hypothetical protein
MPIQRQRQPTIWGIPVPDIFLKPKKIDPTEVIEDGPVIKGEPNIPLIIGTAVMAVVGVAAAIFNRKQGRHHV